MALLRLVVFAGAVVFAALHTVGCSGTQRTGYDREQWAHGNPIEAILRSNASASTREGTAVAVLVDTSGSMREKVTEPDGGSRRKIEIAKDCVAGLVRQTAAFAGEHPDREILLAVYEFSERDRAEFREVLPMGKPDASAAAAAVGRMSASGGTPIGNAMIEAMRSLVATGLSRRHVLVITDGENTTGYAPGDVADAISRLPEQSRAAVYFVAFDISADRFNAVRDAGGLVLEASNQTDLTHTLDFVLTGKILAEKAE